MYALYEIIFFSSFFKVKNITLNGDFNYVSYTDISQVINSATLGRSIFTISSYDLSELLSKNFLAARRIQVKKKIPSSLIITIEERVPVAVVNKQEGEETFIVDNDGFVLGIADERFDTFPQVEYGEDILVGKFLDKNLIPLSMEIIKDANDNDLQISSMSFSENYVTVYLEPNFIVYLDSGDVVSKSMSVVAALVKKLVLEGKTVSKIDLRYDKVVVSY